MVAVTVRIVLGLCGMPKSGLPCGGRVLFPARKVLRVEFVALPHVVTERAAQHHVAVDVHLGPLRDERVGDL